MPYAMPDLIRRIVPLGLALAAALVLSGCQLAAPDGTGDAVTPNAVAGDPIEVTALEGPGPAPTDIATDTGVPAEAPVEGAADAPADPAAGEPAAEELAAKELATEELAPEELAPEELAPADPALPKSPEALACEKKGGTWSNTGLGALQTCIFRTRDGGEQCQRESDCEGVCLARSGTCSPFKPLLGCNEILQDNGVRATLCIE